MATDNVLREQTDKCKMVAVWQRCVIKLQPTGSTSFEFTNHVAFATFYLFICFIICFYFFAAPSVVNSVISPPPQTPTHPVDGPVCLCNEHVANSTDEHFLTLICF
ncbi:hypothetical protein AMECASPLE_037010 [Ameca splendens]|uniref:Transmembrane protein n=1 Tax=Ameca splendens TaxID=208324 RepID=A0ABV1A451_9TELE